MPHAKVTITEPSPGQVTVTVEADPPIPLLADGSPDIDDPAFAIYHAAAIHAATSIGDASEMTVQWRALFKRADADDIENYVAWICPRHGLLSDREVRAGVIEERPECRLSLGEASCPELPRRVTLIEAP